MTKKGARSGSVGCVLLGPNCGSVVLAKPFALAQLTTAVDQLINWVHKTVSRPKGC